MRTNTPLTLDLLVEGTLAGNCLNGESAGFQFMKTSLQENGACGGARKLTQDYNLTWDDPYITGPLCE